MSLEALMRAVRPASGDCSLLVGHSALPYVTARGAWGAVLLRERHRHLRAAEGDLSQENGVTPQGCGTRSVGGAGPTG